MKKIIIFFALMLTVVCSKAQHAVADPYTGITYSRLQVVGYCLIAVGIGVVADGLISDPSAPSFEKPLIFLCGGIFIAGGTELVVIGKKRMNKKVNE